MFLSTTQNPTLPIFQSKPQANTLYLTNSYRRVVWPWLVWLFRMVHWFQLGFPQRCGSSIHSLQIVATPWICKMKPILKPCSHVTAALSFASNVMNGFHGNKWLCSHLMLVFLRARWQRSNINTDVTCEWIFTSTNHWKLTQTLSCYQNEIQHLANCCLWVQRESNLMFTLRGDKDQRKNRLWVRFRSMQINLNIRTV